ATSSIWEDLSAGERSFNDTASLEDGYDLLLGGGDRRTGGSLADFLRPVQSLIFIPVSHAVEHGGTSRIPFHALVHDGRYLVERHDVAYAPSAAAWRQSLGAGRGVSRSALLVGSDPDIDAVSECLELKRVLSAA